jgi:hypothetical protein
MDPGAQTKRGGDAGLMRLLLGGGYAPAALLIHSGAIVPKVHRVLGAPKVVSAVTSEPPLIGCEIHQGV